MKTPQEIKQYADGLALKRYPILQVYPDIDDNEDKREAFAQCFIDNYKESDAVEFTKWRDENRDMDGIILNDNGIIMSYEEEYELFKQYKLK